MTEAWSAVVPETLRLTFADGSVVQTTALHRFNVSGQGWVPAGRLALGTSIVTRAGPPLALAASERVAGERTVYNIEVAGTKTYYVLAGDEDLWVHNAKARPGSSLPVKGGPPNGTLVEDRPGGGTIRKYKEDGDAKTDFDFCHDHGAGDPHAHDWRIGPNGKPQRDKGRPILPWETY